MTSLEDGHDHPQFGVWEYKPTSFYKSVLYLRHCSSRSSHSAQGRVLPQLPWGARMNLWPPSRSCIIPAVATEPTLNTQNTQFPPDGPNCQPSMGIWEPLANQLEHSYEIWCKTYTITAAVCKYLPFHQYSDTHIHVQGGIEPSPFSGKVCRDVWVHLQIFLLVCFHCGHHITGGEGLSYKSGLVLVILDLPLCPEFLKWIKCMVCLQGVCDPPWPLNNLLSIPVSLQWAAVCIFVLCPNFC